jgi:hypothetical protein
VPLDPVAAHPSIEHAESPFLNERIIHGRLFLGETLNRSFEAKVTIVPATHSWQRGRQL